MPNYSYTRLALGGLVNIAMASIEPTNKEIVIDFRHFVCSRAIFRRAFRLIPALRGIHVRKTQYTAFFDSMVLLEGSSLLYFPQFISLLAL